jgi:hypothetical protein
MGLARIFLRLVGAMSICFGLGYVAMPGPMIDAAGFGAVPASGLTDVRATYGGLQIGLGVFLLWAAGVESQVRAGLLLVLFSIGAVGAGRSIGIMVDGDFTDFHLAGLVTEVTLTVFTLIVMVRLPDEAMPQASA